MPSGKTHLSVGVGTGLAMGAALPYDTDFWWKLGATIALCSIAALAPDLDIDNNELEEMGRNRSSGMGRRLRGIARDSDGFDRAAAWSVGLLLRLVGEIVSRAVETLAWLIQRLTTHRGITHSVLVLSVTTAVALWLSQRLTDGKDIWWGLTWGAGYLSHLVADSWTWSGIKFWQPWSERRTWLLPRPLCFRVGTWRDTLLRTVSPVVGLIVLLWQQGVLDKALSIR